MDDQGSSTLTKLILNNFIVQKRPLARQGKDHVIKKLIRQAKKLREKKTEDDKQKEKFQHKAERLVEEVMALKPMRPDDVIKFVLLNKKSFSSVCKNPKAKMEERALCRLAEHKGISTAISKLREQYPNWNEEVPLIIKGLGILHREKKLKKLKMKGQLERYLEKERQSLQRLQELTDIDIDPRILQGVDPAGKTGGKKKASSRSRKRKREMNLNLKSEDEGVIKRKGVTKTNKIQKTNQGKKKDIRDSRSDLGESMGDMEDGTGDNDESVSVEMKRQIRTESTLDDSDQCNEEESDDEEKEPALGGDSSGGEDETSDFVVGASGKKLKEEKGNDSDSNEESISEGEESEHANSDSDCSEEEMRKVSMKKKLINAKYPTVKKIPKTSGTAEVKRLDLTNMTGTIDKKIQKPSRTSEVKQLDLTNMTGTIDKKTQKPSRTSEVKQLDLTNINGIIEGSEAQAMSDSEDEENLFSKTKPKNVKKKKRSDFFLGSGRGGDGGESAEGDWGSEGEGDEESEDSGIIDTSKFFKKNLFRKDDGTRDTERGRGGSRGWGSDRSRRGGFGDKRGSFGDKRGGFGDKRGGFGDRSEDSEYRRGGFRDKRGGFGDRSGGFGVKRGGFGDRRGGFGDKRGSFGDRRGGFRDRSEDSEDRKGGPGDKGEDSGDSRGGHGDRRGGRGDRRGSFGDRRGGRGGSFTQFPWKGNPNMIPLASKDDGPAAPLTGGTSSTDNMQNIHPSWQAKLRQSSSITQFQGGHIVFNEDD
ncbi:eukaryotic translation initiation factor 3 subunit A-like [Homarus americanus]|nr:eukaryotic translation initiation factor 3 subunit A-like [Homarus americanus]XP_042211244.1 eukaryotic translation initiation factor 3 subunit A-like [Homarus americanus]